MNMHKSARLPPAGRALLVEWVEEEGWAMADVGRCMGVNRRTVWESLKRIEWQRANTGERQGANGLHRLLSHQMTSV